MDEPKVNEYRDRLHAEVLEDLETGEHGYKYRMLDGVVMPPYITPARYETSRTLTTRSGDVCYVSFPKSGSTWLSYILVLLLHDGEPPDSATLRDSLHWVASSYTYPRSREELDALPSPRIFKSHMPYQMAFGGDPAANPCRYVYIARNPKDVVVSYYHFEREKSWSGYYSGTWEHWLKMFVDGRVQRGDWFDHVLGWWQRRDPEKVHFLTYEGLRRDFDGEVTRLAAFLGYELTPELLERIRESTAFERMKTTDFANMHEILELDGFFRKGQIGSWKDQFTVAQSEWFDSVYAQRVGGSGLELVFE